MTLDKLADGRFASCLHNVMDTERCTDALFPNLGCKAGGARTKFNGKGNARRSIYWRLGLCLGFDAEAAPVSGGDVLGSGVSAHFLDPDAASLLSVT